MSATSLNSSGFVTRGALVPALNVFGTQVYVLADGASTAGACSIARIVCPPDSGSPLHRHAEAETFHVLRGQLSVILDGKTHVLSAGDLVHITPHAAHNFHNATNEPVEFLALGMPAGHERFFYDADELFRSGRFTPATAVELCQRHGIELLPPN